MSIPYIAKDEFGFGTLYVDGRPWMGLGGELKNSSFSSLEYMDKKVWPNLRPLGLDTIITPIAWENIEPSEGEFCFDLLDGLIDQARRENVRLMLLWFGLWKNGESMYTPGWVKRDTKRFFRARQHTGGMSDTVSPLCQAGVEADARAFSRMMRHLKEYDAETCTVISVQVENEIGFLGSERDFSEQANAAFAQPVPEAVAALCGKSGDWSAALHEDAPEWFMGWHYARAVEQIASAGKAEYPLPLYVNAWLEQFPERPGVHPSGGPIAKLMPLWQAGAPTIDVFAPDIYVSDFVGVCEAYTQHGNPLLIPEARRDPQTASNAFWAFGHHRAIVFAPFGIDEFMDNLAPVPDRALMTELNIDWGSFNCAGTAPYLIRSYELLREAKPLLMKRRGELRAFIKKSNHDRGVILSMGECDLQITYPNEEQGKPGSAGIVIELSPNEFLIMGCRFSVQPLIKRNSHQHLTLSRLEEGELRSGEWVPGRILNGDERGLLRVGDLAGAFKATVCLSGI